jgi:hypothetical protein
LRSIWTDVGPKDRKEERKESQGEHHRKQRFREGFVALLDKHGIANDERYLWV